MALKTTVEHLMKILHGISHDLEKAGRGNRAASQRVRTNTIKFAKVAKTYRKESIAEARKGEGKRKKARKVAKKRPTKRKAAAKRKTTKRRKTTRRKRR